MANDLNEKYPHLSRHKDFGRLYMRYSEALLHDAEDAIKGYVESGCSEEAFEEQCSFGFGDFINWHNDDIPTNDLFALVEESWHSISCDADAVFYISIRGDIPTCDEAAAIAEMLSNDIPKDTDHIGDVKDYKVELDDYTFEEKNGYATYAVNCRLGAIPEPPEYVYYDYDFNPMCRLEAAIKSKLADEGYKVIYAIDRYCDVTFALSVDGASSAEQVQEWAENAWRTITERHCDCYLAVKQGDAPNAFLVDYGYNEVVPVIEGYAGDYYEPPYPDEYDTCEAEEKAEEMGKELKAAIESLGHTVTECTVRENRVESDERLDEKKTIRGLVEYVGVMRTGESTTSVGFGESDYTVKVTKTLDSESHVVDLEIREGKLRDGGYHIIGRIDNIPFHMFAHALDKLIQDETNPRLADLLNASPENAIKKDSQEHANR